ncbi:MAG: endopolygalacturonase, partial [Chitinivibrionales bacterium]|nr:endopolygalacturonase [Chitinivibrionales bacterium]
MAQKTVQNQERVSGMTKKKISAIGLCILGAAILQHVSAENIVFPSGARVVDVTQRPYNAVNDGSVDVSDSIQRALDDNSSSNAIIYLPNGIYKVTKTLRWSEGIGGGEYKETILQGQSMDSTIIRLADSCEGYENAGGAVGVVWTGPAPAQRFRNAVRDLTISTGTGNPGAAALQFNASNQGCVRNVRLVSEDRLGAIGLDMAYAQEIGPLLVKNLHVVGFHTGIKAGFMINSQTFENIRLEQQTGYGIYCTDQIISIHDIRFTGNVPMLYCSGNSVATIVRARITGTGGAQDKSAIINNAVLYARDIEASGFAEAIDNQAGTATASGLSIDEFISHQSPGLFPSPQGSLKLTIRATPEIPWDPLDQWQKVHKTGVINTQDLQSAIDAGKTTVYLPRGNYRLDDTIYVRGNVRRIIGCEASFSVMDTAKPAAFIIEDGTYPEVVLERFSSNGPLTFNNVSGRTL